MYTILMRNDKSLVTSVRTTLYQRESLVNKIQFLLPQTYEDKSILDYSVLFKYTDQANVAHTQVLKSDEELYKNMIRYVIDVDIGITKFAGIITGHLSFLKLNTETGLKEEVFHSGETTIEIRPVKDLYAFVTDESLEIIDRAMLELEAKSKALDLISTTYDSEKADDIELDSKSIYLTSHGKKVGKEIYLSDLGNSISDETDDGLIRVITEDEITVPSDDPNITIKYSLELNQDTDELYLLANGKVVSVISSKEIAESIIDSTSDEGLNEVIT